MDLRRAESPDSITCVFHHAESKPQTAVSSAFEEKIALAPNQQWTAQRAKPGLLGLLPTAAVLIMTLGFVALILGVLLWFQCEEIQGGRGIMAAFRTGYFETVEGYSHELNPKSHLWVLTISSLAVWLAHQAFGVFFHPFDCGSLRLLGTIMEPGATAENVSRIYVASDSCAWGNDMGFRAMTNSSEARFHTRIVGEDTAVVIRGPNYAELNNTNFNVTTFAARTNCVSINHLCKQEDGVTVNCTSAGYPQLPYFRGNQSGGPSLDQVPSRVFGIVDGNLLGRQSGGFDGLAFSTNPTKLVVQLQWEPLEQGVMDGIHAITTPTDLAIDRLPHKPTLYASCDLTFFDAIIRWHGVEKEWYLVNTTVSSSERASTLWLPVIWQHATEQLAANLMHTARRDPRDGVMAELGRNLAKLSLATAAGFYSPNEVLDLDKTEAILVSAYPVLPVMALIMLLCTYALIALALFVSSCYLRDESIIVPPGGPGSRDEEVEPSMLTLAQRWLTNPLPLVGSAFPRGDGLDGTRSAAYYAINAAYDGDDAHTRLAIGLNGDNFRFWIDIEWTSAGVSGSGTDSGSTVGLVGVTGALTVTSVTSRSWTVFRRLWRLVVDRIEVGTPLPATG
ncbi:hypothetical protein M407DRAFT_5819 [Tulasnella calospora MUT 4182]|uniref:Uncharacterized protein n=1 Tax=Tulasnella calospora MUT 4182 TaxID=1051891 RepID=A0A0C3M8U4_9AGAM|nr:hypothetical protein M407DRAFT_5819 [Tulasnella calospora MUT 4182]